MTDEFPAPSTEEYSIEPPYGDEPQYLTPRYLDQPEDFFHIDKTLVMLIGAAIACFLLGMLFGALVW